jgi:6-pyruvoyl-tetrahydropterin synthase
MAIESADAQVHRHAMTVRMELSVLRTFVAAHSLPAIGIAEQHEHTYELRCGYAAHVTPAAGCTRPLQELTAEVDDVLSRIDRKDLNTALPVPPTAEMLACWILAQLPLTWDWASITAYGGYTCRVVRADIGSCLPLLRTRTEP